MPTSAVRAPSLQMTLLRVVLFAVFVVSFVIASAAAFAAEKRPNLIVLLVDDLRWNTLGFMGDSVVQSPNIDKLAARGVSFRNCFVTTSICWVSRASIFTGTWYSRHRIERSNMTLNEQQWANSYPKLLRSVGYRTGFIGKFGVGGTKEFKAIAGDFDYWRGLPGQGGDFFEADDPMHTHKTARFGNEALEFISGCKSDQPFCLSLSFNAVHARDKEAREYPPDDRDAHLYDDKQMPVPPLATDAAWRRLPADVQECEGRIRWKLRFDTPEKTQSILRDYYRLITGVDREVGRIVEALENAKLADNTIIIFTSDNGYALGDRGMADKWFMYEEDIRIPLVVYDPRLSSDMRGRTIDAMTLNVDIPPTLLELAGVSIPPSMQGRSLVPMIEENRTPNDWRTDFFYEHHFSGAVSIPSTEGVRTEDFAYVRWANANPVGEELYDLRTDPLEERNLVNDPSYAMKLDSLRKRWAVLKEQAK